MPETIDRLVRSRAVDHGAKPAVIDPEAGVGKGTRVGLIMPNGVRWVQLAIALTRVGAVLVPLSTLLTKSELVAQLRTASVQFLVSVEEFRGHRYLEDLRSVPQLELPALRDVWPVNRLADIDAGERARQIVDAVTDAVTPADPLVIMFTSGSSGAPKGVVHSHGSALGAVRSGLAARCITADTRLYLPMPFFWVGGFGSGLLSTLAAGSTLVTEAIPRPDTTLRLLQSERVTLFRGWPDQAEALARHAAEIGADLSSLGAGSLQALLPIERRAAPGARATLFGMTETFGPYCGFPADTDMPPTARGSCGKPFPGMEVRIIDPDTGDPVAPKTTGMIQVRGPHTLRGICGRSREDVFNADGFYPTGDLGHLDENGFLFYHGRSDDMFKVSGATVYPGEVERALRTIDGVDGAFVTNVPGPQGERVGTAVVCGKRALTAEQLRNTARELLSAFKVPTVWLVLESDDHVPRGATGKVDARRLREMLIDASQPDGTRVQG